MTGPTTYRTQRGGTVNQALRGITTNDLTNDVGCPTCGKSLTLATDGNGGLVGIEANGRRHRHRGEALRDPEAMREAAAMRDTPEEDA